MSGSAVPGALFNDGKDPAALRTIGEVADALDIRQHVLRYWEEQFPQLRPVKRSGGRRYYRPEDVALVMEIDRLVHREGYTLKGARQVLSAPSKASSVAHTITAEADAQPDHALAARLLAIRQNLAAALLTN